jgi:23S rRNA pseudouridine2457 synthase
MPRLILVNKPFHVLCKFSDHQGRATLADYVPVPDVYPAGRLDYDSEGLVILTDWGKLQARIASPKHKLKKTYWVQVERAPSDAAMRRLAAGIRLKDGVTLPADVARMEPPPIWPRTPPIRERTSVPTCWLSLSLYEGRNRQVRRMTAAVGHPTLRLIRAAVGPWRLRGLLPGQWVEISLPTRWPDVLALLKQNQSAD